MEIARRTCSPGTARPSWVVLAAIGIAAGPALSQTSSRDAAGAHDARPEAGPKSPPAAFGRRPVLKIEAGDARVRLPGDDRPWQDVAAPGRALETGEVVSSGQAFRGMVVYADGTTLAVKPGTMLQVLADGLRLHRGQTWIKVTKRDRGFTCVTPSAIASVRGTSFSCEVPSLGRLFARRHRREFMNPGHLAGGVRGHLVTVSMGLAIISGLMTDAPGGRVPVAVKVYEGRVMVVYPAVSGSIKQTWFLDSGEKVEITDGEHSQKVQVARADYERWGLVPATGAAAAPLGGPAATTGRRPEAAGVRPGPAARGAGSAHGPVETGRIDLIHETFETGGAAAGPGY
jgi:hypothetical protein